jgi:hypothetical protein
LNQVKRELRTQKNGKDRMTKIPELIGFFAFGFELTTGKTSQKTHFEAAQEGGR